MTRFLAPFQAPSRAMSGSDPFSELHREMNRLLEEFVGTGSIGAQGGLMSVPRMDVKENPQEVCVCAELPGVKPQDVDVQVEGNLLTIRGEKKGELAQKQDDFHVMERSFGRFQRSIQLPFAPDADQVRAQFEHGVLTVHLPKQLQQERSRRIAIQAVPPAGSTGPQAHAVQAGPSAHGPDKSHH